MVENGSRNELRGGAHGAVQWGKVTGVLVLTTVLAGCSHLHWPQWPWRHKPTPPPEVHELDETSEGGAAVSFPQYWMRNTLVVDLQGASGTGSVTLKPREHTEWPIRVAFKVTPGSVGEIEVKGAQRVVLPITTTGTKPIVLELTPGTFSMKTPQMVVSWGPSSTPAE
jgi:hypothetical protein